jgi:hypothetical protein
MERLDSMDLAIQLAIFRSSAGLTRASLTVGGERGRGEARAPALQK